MKRASRKGSPFSFGSAVNFPPACRDPGRQDAASQGLAGTAGPVWDGRFEVSRPAELLPLRGQGSRLSPDEARRLRRLPAMVRPTLPALRDAHGVVTCPLLAERTAFDVRCLVGRRLAAAAGLIASEAQVARGPDGEEEAGALS